MNKFIFGKYRYSYELIRSKRKTLSLTVNPDLKIILKCPEKTETKRIEEFLKRKWSWLEKQLLFFKKHQKKTSRREYVTGAEYRYLGKQYTLIIKKGDADKVLLTKNKLVVYTQKAVSNKNQNKELIEDWYFAKTKKVFQTRFNEMYIKFDYKKKPELSIREMKRRWGSFLRKDKILLNPKLINAPKECIDYVIVHELCHLKYKNHSRLFWNYLSVKYPNWKKIKEKLEMYS